MMAGPDRGVTLFQPREVEELTPEEAEQMRGGSAPAVSEITVTKLTDCASTSFFRNCSAGAHF
jgi:hypothetical protein